MSGKMLSGNYIINPDLMDYVTFGEENRITINVNTGVQPSSRWYTGSGLFRGVTLCHSPRVFVLPDGINVVTRLPFWRHRWRSEMRHWRTIWWK